MSDDPHYSDIISRFAGKRVLVAGDFMLDVFIHGVSTRLCPEAPVPVVDVTTRTICAGGAANAAANLTALGATVVFCSVLGDDREGHEAINFLEQNNWDTSGIFLRPERRTIVKTRIVAGSQVITRVDDGTVTPIDAAATHTVTQFLRDHYSSFDAIIFSDYDKGFFTTAVRDELLDLDRVHRKFLAVDSKRPGFFRELRPFLVKPNYEEACRLIGNEQLHSNRIEQMRSGLDRLKKQTGAHLIALTLDAEGSLLIKDGEEVAHVKATPVQSPQVSGAGDAYLSAFVLAYLETRDVPLSGTIASVAAGIAISKKSTAFCSSQELKLGFTLQQKYVRSLSELADICDSYHSQGKRIVFTNGCFDILHSGHVGYLDSARETGDVLIVGMNTDESISRIKGADRPINSFHDRLKVLSGLKSVDHVVAFGNQSDDTPASLIRIVKPDVFVKGGDYSIEKLPELPALVEANSEIIFLPRTPDRSTSAVIQKISNLADVAT